MVPDLILDPPSSTRWFCSFESLFRVVHPESPRKSPFGMMTILRTISTNTAYSGTEVGKVVREYREQIRSKWNAESRTSGKVVLSKTAAFLCDSVAGFVTGAGSDGFFPIIRSFCESLVGAVRPVRGATGPSKFYDITRELPVLRSQSAPVVVGGNLSVSTGGPGDFIVQAWSDLGLNYQLALHFVVLCVYSFAPRTTSLQKLLWFVSFVAKTFLGVLTLIGTSQLNDIVTFASNTSLDESREFPVSSTQRLVTNTTWSTLLNICWGGFFITAVAIARVYVPAILPTLSEIQTVGDQAVSPGIPRRFGERTVTAVRYLIESEAARLIFRPGREWLNLFWGGEANVSNTAYAILSSMFTATIFYHAISVAIDAEQDDFFRNTGPQFMRLVDEYVAQFNFVDVLPMVMAISAPAVEGAMKFLEAEFLANDMPRGVVLARRFQSAYQEAVIAVSLTSLVVASGLFDSSGAVFQQFQPISTLQNLANNMRVGSIANFLTDFFRDRLGLKWLWTFGTGQLYRNFLQVVFQFRVHWGLRLLMTNLCFFQGTFGTRLNRRLQHTFSVLDLLRAIQFLCIMCSTSCGSLGQLRSSTAGQANRTESGMAILRPFLPESNFMCLSR